MLLGWGAAAYVFHVYFTGLRDFGPPTYWAAAIAGLFVVAAVSYFFGIGGAHGERKMLLEAMAGTPPEDGKWAAVSGTIRASTPLTAPISGQSVVAYEYSIHRHERRGSQSSEVVYYEGKALAPSSIATRQGSVRLLAVPAFTVIDEVIVDRAAAVRNARAYVARTDFAKHETSGERRGRLEQEWTDDDGQYRLDKRFTDEKVELTDDFEYDEKQIGQGEQICAFGVYSAERRGLIPHANWSKQTRIVRGDVAAVSDRLRRRMINCSIGALACSAIVWGIVWFYRNNS
jgi:hypothetical protein